MVLDIYGNEGCQWLWEFLFLASPSVEISFSFHPPLYSPLQVFFFFFMPETTPASSSTAQKVKENKERAARRLQCFILCFPQCWMWHG